MKNSDLANVNCDELLKESPASKKAVFEKLGIAALNAIPWIGGVIAALANMPGELQSAKLDHLRTQWLLEHEKKFAQLRLDVNDITSRLENLGPEVEERVHSPEYLALVRQGFRIWDQAETEDKRRYVRNLLTNSGGTRVCSDDVVRLFVGWLNQYNEMHFAVIRHISQKPASTRFEIWDAMYGDLPREDSAEADLYKLLMRDLSTGGVIRQARDTNEAGQFLRHERKRRRGPASTTVETAFEDTKPYVLTELGKQFVHYTMNEVVTRLGK